MILPEKDYGDKCWWCNSIANTKEHVYKKSDFELLFGKTNFPREDEPVIMDVETGNVIKSIQGSNSKFLKYKQLNLCSECNNSKSSSMDRAYQKVMQYIYENGQEIIDKQIIDFRKIFLANPEKQKIEFHKYCIKHLGCRLASNKLEVPNSLISFLNGNTESRPYKIKFRIRHDMHYLQSNFDIDLKILLTRTLQKIYLKQDGVRIGEGVISIYFFQWFRLIIIYSELFKENNFSMDENFLEPVQLTAFNQEVDINLLNLDEKKEYLLWSIEEEKKII